MIDFDNIAKFISQHQLTERHQVELVLRHGGDTSKVFQQTQDPELLWEFAQRGQLPPQQSRRAACLTAALFSPLIGLDYAVMRQRLQQRFRNNDPAITLTLDEAKRRLNTLHGLAWNAQTEAARCVVDAINLSSVTQSPTTLMAQMIRTVALLKSACEKYSMPPDSPLLVTKAQLKETFFKEYQDT